MVDIRTPRLQSDTLCGTTETPGMKRPLAIPLDTVDSVGFRRRTSKTLAIVAASTAVLAIAFVIAANAARNSQDIK
jgi:hypothetical protein